MRQVLFTLSLALIISSTIGCEPPKDAKKTANEPSTPTTSETESFSVAKTKELEAEVKKLSAQLKESQQFKEANQELSRQLESVTKQRDSLSLREKQLTQSLSSIQKSISIIGKETNGLNKTIDQLVGPEKVEAKKETSKKQPTPVNDASEDPASKAKTPTEAKN